MHSFVLVMHSCSPVLSLKPGFCKCISGPGFGIIKWSIQPLQVCFVMVSGKGDKCLLVRCLQFLYMRNEDLLVQFLSFSFLFFIFHFHRPFSVHSLHSSLTVLQFIFHSFTVWGQPFIKQPYSIQIFIGICI